MSATLDAAVVSRLLGDAPVIVSPGRAFPVATVWCPPRARQSWEAAVAAAVGLALRDQATGDVLVFLPGVGEIRRVRGLLGSVDADVLDLHGGLDTGAQDAALRSSSGRRRVVLATAIAQTSVTLPDVTAVVDGGLARRSRFDPRRGIGGLVTEPGRRELGSSLPRCCRESSTPVRLAGCGGRPPCHTVGRAGNGCTAALLDGIRAEGTALLHPSADSQRWRERVMVCRRYLGHSWPDVSDQILLENISTWLGPLLAGCLKRADLARVDTNSAVRSLLPWPLSREIDELALPISQCRPVRVSLSTTRPKSRPSP